MLDDVILSMAILPNEYFTCQQVAQTMGESDYDYVENLMNRHTVETKAIIKAFILPNGYSIYKLNMDNDVTRFHLNFVEAYTH